MSKPLILCASALLAALSLATPAATRHADRANDESSGLRPDETERLRVRAEHQIARASRRLEELARSGAQTEEQLARACVLRERVARQTQQIFADERVTAEEQQALRSLKREARAFRRELRENMRRRHRARIG